MAMKKCLRIVLAASLVMSCWILPPAQAESINDLTLLTEQYPPFNFKKDGALQGISTDLLVEVLEKAGSKLARKDIKLLPWARGYRMALAQKNTCLFATTRTQEREELFKWVGPIAPTVIALTGRKDKNIQIDNMDEINKYTIGVIRDDIGEQLLVNAGIDANNLKKVASTIQNIRKLDAGRIDLLAYEENVTKWEIKQNGFNPNDFETVYVLKKGELYYALHKDTPDSVVNKLQGALDAIKRQDEYQKILRKYLE